MMYLCRDMGRKGRGIWKGKGNVEGKGRRYGSEKKGKGRIKSMNIDDFFKNYNYDNNNKSC